MQIVKDGVLVEDGWRHLADDEALPAQGDITVSFKRFDLDNRALAAYAGRVGVRLTGDDDWIGTVGSNHSLFPLLVIEFPTMADGRGFTIARLLRDHCGYKGELRARGQFIRDQVFFLHRVGINAFEPSTCNAADLLPAFNDFSVRYQASQDEPLPIYRRR